jgi:glycosyltransferase involved in cell wall biosynthesis
MSIAISVIIPTYNPAPAIITETLNSLKAQTLDHYNWELLIIDNNSTNDVPSTLNLSWHPNAAVIKELKQGLTYGRICGFSHAKGDIVIMVDDDNVLTPDYLQLVQSHFNDNLKLGAAGGKIDGKFNGFTPDEWTRQFWEMLAIRNLGDKPLISDASFSKKYPVFAPVGAGMAIRKELLTAYIDTINNQNSVITDRIGNSLSSGGDNEIVINVLKQNFAVGYFPDLVMQHIIPASRFTFSYLARLNYASSKSWITLLLNYDMCPWERVSRYSIGLRKLKAWVAHKAWKGNAEYIKWQGACGTFEGLSTK